MTPESFAKMRYDVTSVPEKKRVIEVFPELAEHSEYKDPKNDKFIRIAFLATDENSPFVLLEREDYEKRLIKIFNYLAIYDDGLIEVLVRGQNQDYEKIVNRFLMQVDNLAYIMYENKLRTFHYMGISLRSAPDTSDMAKMVKEMGQRATLDKQMKEVYNDLLEYSSQVFPDVPSRKKIQKQITKLFQPAESHAQPKSVI